MQTFLILILSGLALIFIPLILFIIFPEWKGFFLAAMIIAFGQLLFKLGIFYGVIYFIFHCFGLFETYTAMHVWGCTAIAYLLTLIFTKNGGNKE